MLSEHYSIIDITPELNEKTAVFPGDTPFERKVVFDFAKGDHLVLSNVSGSCHLGAHTDAPNHYHAKGVGIEKRPLDFYLGPCQVISTQGLGRARIGLSALKGRPIIAPRVLFRTLSFPDPNEWTNDFTSLSPEVVDYLAEKGVRLVGIDTPSIDPWDSKLLESHQRIAAHDMAILEGVVLREVKDRVYWLVSMPLKIVHGDASWVRAVLLDFKGEAYV